MPKVHGTRRQKAAELLSRLKNGPEILFYKPFGPFELIEAGQAEEHFKENYKLWVEAWVIGQLKELVPELREKNS